MGVREKIMAIENHYLGYQRYEGFEHGKEASADIAEACEKKLLAEKAALIAELRAEMKNGYAIVGTEQVESILAKYEEKK